MSTSGRIARRVTEDAKRILRRPRSAYEEVAYTVEGLRTGTVSPRSVAWSVVSTAGTAVMVLVVLFPLYWIFTASLSSSGGSIYAAGGFRFFPADPTVQNYVWVVGDLILPSYRITLTIPLTNLELFVDTPGVELLDASDHGVTNPSDFQRYLGNSLSVAIPTVLLSMSVIVPASYALSRREFILRKRVLYLYVLLTQVGGGLGIAALVALYALFVRFGIVNNKLALAVYYAGISVPFNTWLLKTYMDGIPVSYEEAAVVDGAPAWRVAYEVILPLSKAGLATVFIFTFLTGWTEFLVAQTLLSTENYTLPVGLFNLVGQYSIPWARFSAFALLFALPIMLVYLFTQRYIEGGLSFSGMEG
jgi:arabinogalactan oligomer/maltooligosaccharide transport system permease protein